MTSRKIYIAGPMRGLPDDNREAFFAVAKFLKTLWYDVDLTLVNPAETDVSLGVDPETCTTKDFQDYLRADLKDLMTCDEIVLLPGWEASEGASCELVVARALGLKLHVAFVHKDANGKDYCSYTSVLKFSGPWRMGDWKLSAKSLEVEQALQDVCGGAGRKAAKAEIDATRGSFTAPLESVLGTRGAPSGCFPLKFTDFQKGEPKNVAEEAIGLVTKARNANYGPPKEDFERTAQIVHALIGVHMTASDIAKVMIAVKLSRETHKHKRDNLVDIIGYVLCMAEFYEDSKALKPGEALEATEGSRS